MNGVTCRMVVITHYLFVRRINMLWNLINGLVRLLVDYPWVILICQDSNPVTLGLMIL